MTSSALPAPNAPARRTTVEEVLAASTLPIELKNVVRAVEGATKLWRSEKVLVAKELCAHFEDGISAGVGAEELVDSFGDVRQAALLIRRARKRLRPWWWRSAVRALQGWATLTTICVALYLVLVARFYLASPNVSRNYMAEMNARTAKTAESDRAWPLYLQSIKAFGSYPEFQSADGFRADKPGDRDWDAMARWIGEKQPAFALLRSAAARPELGIQYGSKLSAEYLEVQIANGLITNSPTIEAEPENPLLLGVLLPHLGEMRKLSRWLRADAILAAHHLDGERFLSDIDAILGIAKHAAQDKILIGSLVGVAVADLAVGVARDHATTPGLLKDEQLERVAHSIAGFSRGTMRLPVANESLMLEDIVQRFYSDDGHGDGRIVHSAETEQISRDFGVRTPDHQAWLNALRPVRSAALPSRKEIQTKISTFVAQAELDDSLPPWRHDERRSDHLYLDVCQSGLFDVLPVIRALMGNPSGDEGMLSSAFERRDMFEADRGAVEIMLAAELFRRSEGRWPNQLAEMVPKYLPTEPSDPFTGKEMKYREPQGSGNAPLIYSVGPDGVDDGGTPPATEAGRASVRTLRTLRLFRETGQLNAQQLTQSASAKGDWVIIPKTDAN